MKTANLETKAKALTQKPLASLLHSGNATARKGCSVFSPLTFERLMGQTFSWLILWKQGTAHTFKSRCRSSGWYG